MGENTRDPTNGAGNQASVARHAGIVASFTMLSRVAGLVRESVFAHLFGANHTTDAFLTAFRIPNTFRLLVAEGTLTVAFLPVFNEAQAKGGEAAARRVMSQATVVFPSLSALLTGLCIIFAEPIVRLYADGFEDVPGKLELATELVQVMFPYLIFISFVALSMGALNARKRFASSAAAPFLFNLVYILGMVSLARVVDPPMMGVAFGVIAGGAAQVALQMIELWRAGLAVRPSFELGPEIRRVLRLMLPAVLALGAYQINIIVLNRLASYLGKAAVSYLWYADRLQQFPLGVFGIAIATASLPAFSDALVADGKDGLIRTFGQSMRLNSFIILPAAAGLIVLALPLTACVYQHGKFVHDGAIASSTALVAFACGLPAVASIRVAGQGFFSMKDTRTPVACGLIGLGCNAALAPILGIELGFVGLAVSVAISGWLQLVAQLTFLRRRLSRLGATRIVRGLGRDLTATTPMAAVVWWLSSRVDWTAGTSIANVAALSGCILAGVAVYAGAQLALGSEELQMMLRGVRRRLSR
jgi:putative peptidoglycan lipid II flippase